MPRQNAPHSEHPSAVLREIEQLGLNITIARKRRGETQGQWASKLGVSQPTMARIERGDPSVAMASYVMCMWLINQANGLADLIAPLQDHAALEREVRRLRQKSKPPSVPKHTPVGPTAPRPVAGSQRGNTPAKPAARRNQKSPPAPAEQSTGGKVGAKKARAITATESTEAIHKHIRASAAKGNATAQGLAALLLGKRPSARR